MNKKSSRWFMRTDFMSYPNSFLGVSLKKVLSFIDISLNFSTVVQIRHHHQRTSAKVYAGNGIFPQLDNFGAVHMIGAPVGVTRVALMSPCRCVKRTYASCSITGNKFSFTF